MENASKALIIAGAILLSILIIAIGMVVYNNASNAINDSLASMSDQEKTAFNSKFTSYENAATGSQIKNMIGDLITTSSTYVDEPAKIVCLTFHDAVSSKVQGENKVLRPDAGDNTNYVNTLGKIRNAVEPKHTYWVEFAYNGSGIIEEIIVYYNKDANP